MMPALLKRFFGILGFGVRRGGEPRSPVAVGDEAGGDSAGITREGSSRPPAFGNIKKFKPELLIIGLGNPGREYDGTRHNIGFEVIDGLCALLGDNVSEPAEQCEAVCRMAVCRPAGSDASGHPYRPDGVGVPAGKPVLLVKPLTYMNLSGEAVCGLARRYGLTPADCLVVVDDFNLPLGKVRLRKDGTHGGHNGLKSVSAAVGDGYPRLRVGIGPLAVGMTIIDFVLGRFDGGEREKVSEVVKVAAEAIIFTVENGVGAAMNRYNR